MHAERRENFLRFTNGARVFDLVVVDEFENNELHDIAALPAEVILSSAKKVASLINSQLHLNKTLFARNCEIRSIDKKAADEFFTAYHLMNSARAAYYYGLFFQNALVMAASFSKGRKMKRLAENERSYELIRLSTKAGVTVTGGLSKLLQHFISVKRPADIMTYVDSQLSNGNAFLRNGFKLIGKTEPLKFMVNVNTLERSIYNEALMKDQPGKFRITVNRGNLKLLLIPDYR